MKALIISALVLTAAQAKATCAARQAGSIVPKTNYSVLMSSQPSQSASAVNAKTAKSTSSQGADGNSKSH